MINTSKYSILELKTAYKQGFRWRPVDFPVQSTPLDTPPPCHFSPFRAGPVYNNGPSLNVIPTALDWYPSPDASEPAPVWGLTDVSTLPKARKTRSTTRSTSSTTTTTTTPASTTASTTTARPRTTASPASTSRPVTQGRSQSSYVAPQILTVAPVVVTGVPGSSQTGTDLVSIILFVVQRAIQCSEY